MKIAVSILIFIISAGIAILFLLNVKAQKEIYAQQPVFVCGNSFFDTEISEQAKQGRSLFKANCAACHKLDAPSTGPMLRNVKQRYIEEGKSIDSFFTKRTITYASIRKNKERKCLISPDITVEDIQKILLYTN